MTMFRHIANLAFFNAIIALEINIIALVVRSIGWDLIKIKFVIAKMVGILVIQLGVVHVI